MHAIGNGAGFGYYALCTLIHMYGVPDLKTQNFENVCNVDPYILMLLFCILAENGIKIYITKTRSLMMVAVA